MIFQCCMYTFLLFWEHTDFKFLILKNFGTILGLQQGPQDV